MASFGDPYPGTGTPAWWYGTTATTSVVSIYPHQYGVAASPARAPVPERERTAVEWLRERVEELCDLAWEPA